MPHSPLHELPDDLVIYLFDLLGVPDILILRQVKLNIRQTCKRMQETSELHIVWTNACYHQILPKGYPFPDVSVEDLSARELEHHVRRAYLLASYWLSDKSPRCAVYAEFEATNGTPVSDLRFVPGHAGNWLISVSKGIWSTLAVWELSNTGSRPRKRFEWSRRDCLLKNFVLNDDPAAEGTVAISVIQYGSVRSRVEIMSIDEEIGFRSIHIMYSALDPVHFHQDLIVLCDNSDLSTVTNWKTGASAALQRPRQNGTATPMGLIDRCIQVLFAAESILVVRSRSLTLFPNPPLTLDTLIVHAPLAEHSFGWVDGVAMAIVIASPRTRTDLVPPLSILIRPEPEDPWTADDDHSLDLYVLRPADIPSLSSPAPACPYAFPPALASRVRSTRGALQCSDIRLGRHGTAVWVEPQNRSAVGLLHAMQDDAHAPVVRQNERLVGAVFPGPLFMGDGGGDFDAEVSVPRVRGRPLWANELNNCKALDYDERRGLVAVGSTRGRITVLSMVSPSSG
ncbi:hypothetical protein GGX14DRAFT_360174 [Mycena pura]|uniref:F-box domain-containing protein n=1 Tax=Mycena pura TaxID=153505 RepID=A0AAD6VKV2_9AGAR|nr:hypothetical protein GGX14DRAFT_360174 [Mycena pura]